MADPPYTGYLSYGRARIRVPVKTDWNQGAESTRGFVTLPQGSSPLRPASGGEKTISRPLFRIRTPTLIVTDRGGSEFGLSFDKSATTTAYVYHGKIDFQTPLDNKGPHPIIPLSETQWVFVTLRPDGSRHVLYPPENGVTPDIFARRLPNDFPMFSQDMKERKKGRRHFLTPDWRRRGILG